MKKDHSNPDTRSPSFDLDFQVTRLEKEGLNLIPFFESSLYSSIDIFCSAPLILCLLAHIKGHELESSKFLSKKRNIILDYLGLSRLSPSFFRKVSVEDINRSLVLKFCEIFINESDDIAFRSLAIKRIRHLPKIDEKILYFFRRDVLPHASSNFLTEVSSSRLNQNRCLHIILYILDSIRMLEFLRINYERMEFTSIAQLTKKHHFLIEQFDREKNYLRIKDFSFADSPFDDYENDGFSIKYISNGKQLFLCSQGLRNCGASYASQLNSSSGNMFFYSVKFKSTQFFEMAMLLLKKDEYGGYFIYELSGFNNASVKLCTRGFVKKWIKMETAKILSSSIENIEKARGKYNEIDFHSLPEVPFSKYPFLDFKNKISYVKNMRELGKLSVKQKDFSLLSHASLAANGDCPIFQINDPPLLKAVVILMKSGTRWKIKKIFGEKELLSGGLVKEWLKRCNRFFGKIAKYQEHLGDVPF